MKTPQVEGDRVARRAQIISLVSLCVSIGAASLSWFEWRENHRVALIQAAPHVSFEEDTDTDDPLVGMKIDNAGPGIARLKNITYYVDRKPVGDVEQAIDFAHLEDVGYFQFDDDDTLPAGEKTWLLSKSTRGKGKEQKNVEQFIDFVDQRLAVEVEVCSVVTGRCQTQCSTDGWCK